MSRRNSSEEEKGTEEKIDSSSSSEEEGGRDYTTDEDRSEVEDYSEVEEEKYEETTVDGRGKILYLKKDIVDTKHSSNTTEDKDSDDDKLLKFVMDQGGLDYTWRYYAYTVVAQAATLYFVSYLVFVIFKEVSEKGADTYPGRGIPVLDFFAKNSPIITGLTNAVLNPYFQKNFFKYFRDVVIFNRARKKLGLPTTWKEDIIKILAATATSVPAALAFVFLDNKFLDRVSDGITFTVQNFLGSKKVLVDGVVEAYSFFKEHGLNSFEVPLHYVTELAKELRYLGTLGRYPYKASPHPLEFKPIMSSYLEDIIKFIEKNIDRISKSEAKDILAKIEKVKAGLPTVSEEDASEVDPLLTTTTEFSWENSKTRQVTRATMSLAVIGLLSYSIMRIFALNTQDEMEAENWFPQSANKAITWGITAPSVSIFGMLVASTIIDLVRQGQDKMDSYVKLGVRGVKTLRQDGWSGLWAKAKESVNTRAKAGEFVIELVKLVLAACYLYFSLFSGGTVNALAKEEGIDNPPTKASLVLISGIFNMVGWLFFSLLIINTLSDVVLKTPEQRRIESGLTQLREFKLAGGNRKDDKGKEKEPADENDDENPYGDDNTNKM